MAEAWHDSVDTDDQLCSRSSHFSWLRQIPRVSRSNCLMLAGEEAPEGKGAARQEAPKGKGTTSETFNEISMTQRFHEIFTWGFPRLVPKNG